MLARPQVAIWEGVAGMPGRRFARESIRRKQKRDRRPWPAKRRTQIGDRNDLSYDSLSRCNLRANISLSVRAPTHSSGWEPLAFEGTRPEKRASVYQPFGHPTAFKLTRPQRTKKWTAPARLRSTIYSLVQSVETMPSPERGPWSALQAGSPSTRYLHASVQKTVLPESLQKQLQSQHACVISSSAEVLSSCQRKILRWITSWPDVSISNIPTIYCSGRRSNPTSVCSIPLFT